MTFQQFSRAGILVSVVVTVWCLLVAFLPHLASLLFLGVPWLVGVCVVVMGAYDWVLRAGEDLDAERRRQDEAKARSGGGSLNQNVH
jgi:hypothetical protein